MRVEKDSKGLNPSVVTGSTSRPVANEVTIDLEVAIRDQAEMLIALAMEVEDYAISTDEAGIIAS